MADKKIRNVLFDLDGTLADTAPDLAFAVNSLLEEKQRPALSLDVVKPLVSLGGIAMVRTAFGIEEDDLEFGELKNRFLEIYRKNIALHTVLFDGIESVLSSLESRHMSWGIVTNKSTWLTLPLMEALRLSERTPCIVCGDTVEHAKPHPAPLLHACDLLHCTPKQTLYVGDALRDIEAGNRAGMTTLVANYGYIGEEDKTQNWGADGEVNSAVEILDWVS